MNRKDYLTFAVAVIFILTSFGLTVGPDVFGTYTGEIGAVFGIVGLVVYGWGGISISTKDDEKVISDLQAFMKIIPPDSEVQHEPSILVDNQIGLLTQLEHGHNILNAQFVSSMLVAPLAVLWAFVFLFAAAPPLERFILEATMVLVAFCTGLVLMWKKGKVFRVYLKASRGYLDNTRKAIAAGRGDVDLTTYINLIFLGLLPDIESKVDEPQRGVAQIRVYLRLMRWMPLVDLVIFGGLLGTFALLFRTVGEGFVYWFLLGPLYGITLLFIGLMVVRYWLYYRWHQLIKRWLQVYTALISWGEDFEKGSLPNKVRMEED